MSGGMMRRLPGWRHHGLPRLLALLLVCPGAGVVSGAEDLAAVGEESLALIADASRRLSGLEEDIAEQRRELASQLAATRARVEALREEAAALRRLEDEKTLGLDQLENRLAQWREQAAFQNRLLASLPDAGDDAARGEHDELERLGEQLSGLAARLEPRWRNAEIALADGRLRQAELLRLGPLQWFWLPGEGLGGLVNAASQPPRAGLHFGAQLTRGLADLHASGVGSIGIDPGLGRAMVLAESRDSLLTHLRKGGLWAIPILLFAVFATLVALAKAFSLWRLPTLQAALPARLENLLGAGDSTALQALRGDLGGAQRDLLDISLRSPPGTQRDDLLFACLQTHRQRLERWLGAIAVTAAVAPLLGLLGTVSGMISTFRLMTLFGAGDPSSVSSGIAEALVTTELGLVVAIPALLAHALMTRKVRNYHGQLESQAVQLSQVAVPEAAR